MAENRFRDRGVVNKKRWQLLRLAIGDDRLPLKVQPSEVSDEEREEARTELRRRPPEQIRRNEETLAAHPDFGKNWWPLRRMLGITAFGVAANEAAAGEPLIIPHDETEHGHEELYLVVYGRAEFTCDSDSFEAKSGDLLYVPAGILRGATALETPTLLFMAGGAPGTYEPPIWAPDWRPPTTWLARKRSPS